MAQVTVRYFAAARSAAGVREETVSARSVSECLDVVCARHGPELVRIVKACSFLLDGQSVKDRDVPIDQPATVDILPPFAGG